MNFDQAVKIILELEGGYVNNPKDPGGETKFGISARAFPGVNIAALTEEVAAHIYRRSYWDAIQADQLPPRLRLAVFDAAVHAGPATAIRFLQRAARVKPDGIPGPKTLAAAAAAGLEELLTAFLTLRLNALQGLQTYGEFGDGWERRLFRVAVES